MVNNIFIARLWSHHAHLQLAQKFHAAYKPHYACLIAYTNDI
jgi:hypothetical protein